MRDDIDQKWVSQTHKLERFQEIFKQISHLAGDFAEFGVYHGNGSRELASLDPRRFVWAFDTFQGMPTEGYDPALDSGDPPGKWVPQASTMELFAGHKNIILIKGEFRETLARWYPFRLALVHVDCDWYSSHKLVTEFLERYLLAGSHVVFDDAHLAGAKKALKEWTERVGPQIAWVKDDEVVWRG